MNLCIYEDIEAQAFGPLTLLRPVFALRCGIFTLAEKLALAFPEAKLHLLVRPHLEEWTREIFPDAEVTEPGDFAGFIRALAEPAPGPELPPGPPTPPDMELVMKTAAEYGLEILGPPGIPA